MTHPHADILEVDAVTGRRTGLARVATRALKALKHAKVPHAVIGATALAVRGLRRMTRDLNVVVLLGMRIVRSTRSRLPGSAP